MKTRLLIIIIVSIIVSITVILVSAFAWIEYGMVCNDNVIEHLQKYSNLFDENTTRETYGTLDIGFPFGVHGGNVKECIDYVLEQRSSMELEK